MTDFDYRELDDDNLPGVMLFGHRFPVKQTPNGFAIGFLNAPYDLDVPPTTFGVLAAIAAQFGTDCIDFDGYSVAGCETCDYGGVHGKIITVSGATKNIPKFKEDR